METVETVVETAVITVVETVVETVVVKQQVAHSEAWQGIAYLMRCASSLLSSLPLSFSS